MITVVAGYLCLEPSFWCRGIRNKTFRDNCANAASLVVKKNTIYDFLISPKRDSKKNIFAFQEHISNKVNDSVYKKKISINIFHKIVS